MDEYWEDYGEFNQEIETFRESLKVAVKDEIKKELETLRVDNKSLRDKVAHLDSLEKEAEATKRKAEYEYESAVKRAGYLKADELFKYLEETKYMLSRRSGLLPKCDNCDEKRHVPFTYPSGKESYEICVTCGTPKYEWEVDTAIGTSIDIRSGDLIIWYKPFSTRDEDDYHSMSGNIKKLYNGESFEQLVEDNYQLLFNDEETAQKYATYLNQKEL